MSEKKHIEPDPIEELAGLQFDPVEIAIICEMDIRDFLVEYGYSNRHAEMESKKHCQKSELWQKIQRGRLKKEHEIRKSVFDMARNGSSPAQSHAMQLIESQRINRKLE